MDLEKRPAEGPKHMELLKITLAEYLSQQGAQFDEFDLLTQIVSKADQIESMLF